MKFSQKFCFSWIALLLLALNSCKQTSVLHCPDLAGVGKQHTIMASGAHYVPHSGNSKSADHVIRANTTHTFSDTALLASESMHFRIKMPDALTKNMQNDQELADMNKMLATYSNNKMALQRNEHGKIFLRTHSVKDIFALAKNTSQPRGYYERRTGTGGGGDAAGSAIASAVLGPIGFVCAFLPFLSIAAIPISIAAIITGAIGLRSHRKGLAITGLTFGILGLILGIFFTWFYIAWLLLVIL